MTCENCKRLELELAKAQAAIAELLNTSTEIGTGVVSEAHVKARINAVNMDTAALDAAISEAVDAAHQEILILRQNQERDIAAAQKPLVDALKSYEYDSNGHIVTWLSEAAHRDALAKVKEENDFTRSSGNREALQNVLG